MNIFSKLHKEFLDVLVEVSWQERRRSHINTSCIENRRHVRARGGAADEDEGVPSAEPNGEGEDGCGQGYQQTQRSGEGVHLSTAGRCAWRLHAHLRQENGRRQHFRYVQFKLGDYAFVTVPRRNFDPRLPESETFSRRNDLCYCFHYFEYFYEKLRFVHVAERSLVFLFPFLQTILFSSVRGSFFFSRRVTW